MPYIALYYLCALTVSMITPTSMAECPRTCECKWKSGKESVVCHNANLTMVPPDLESGTQILDLTENVIISLKHKEFSQAGLVNLQKIFLAKCRLKSIERYAFKNLINLVELDLSYNVLNTIPSSSFESIPELRELRLNGNPIQAISSNSFKSTPQLVKLELSGCRIVTVESKSFSGLEDSLEWLKLDNNKLSEVDAPSFTNLHTLHGLELAGNPWNCSCKLRDLREWMLLQNVPYDIPPICHSPKRLLDKSWKALELDEFACPPKIFANEIKAKGVEGRNVTLSCNIDGTPRPNVKWLLRNKVIAANLSGSSIQVGGKKIYIVNQKSNSSELTIYSADVQDAGIYLCAAENKAGKAEAVVTLTVAKKSADVKFSHKALLVSILLGVTFTFLCCLLAACFVSVRKKRLLKWHSAECRRADNYEKIEMKHRNLNGEANRQDSNNSVLVTITRKNGDYCVVPRTDTDHENDDEEESTLEITTPGTSGGDKKWTNEEPAIVATKNDKIADACRRGMGQDVRDNISRTFISSTYGTYKSPTTDASSLIQTTDAPSWKGHQPNLINNTMIYTTASSIIRQVPDVIGHSSFANKSVSSRTQSENGSVNDINELFCTLPRKKDLARYKSSDSQSLLLPESRYGSDSSSDSFARRLSDATQRYPTMTTTLGRNRTKHNKHSSGSLLNLTKEDKLMSNLNSTPLLDVRGLETMKLSPHQHYQHHQFQASEPAAGNPYDYHAAQLEKFLEEYRILQKQLTKMKETCDSICQDQMRGDDIDSLSPCTASNNYPSSGLSGANLNNRVNSPNSNSIQDSVDFKNFENELTKYLISRSPSTMANFTSGALHN